MKDLLVNIDVEDLEEAEAFYSRAFGLTRGRYLGLECLEMRGGPVKIYLLQNEAGTKASPTTEDKRRYSRHWTPVHIDFIVEKLEDAVIRASAAGARIESEIMVNSWGKMVYASDPFGNGFCLIEFAGGGYDEIETTRE